LVGGTKPCCLALPTCPRAVRRETKRPAADGCRSLRSVRFDLAGVASCTPRWSQGALTRCGETWLVCRCPAQSPGKGPTLISGGSMAARGVGLGAQGIRRRPSWTPWTPWTRGGRPGPGSSGVDIDVLRLVELCGLLENAPHNSDFLYVAQNPQEWVHDRDPPRASVLGSSTSPLDP